MFHNSLIERVLNLKTKGYVFGFVESNLHFFHQVHKGEPGKKQTKKGILGNVNSQTFILPPDTEHGRSVHRALRAREF